MWPHGCFFQIQIAWFASWITACFYPKWRWYSRKQILVYDSDFRPRCISLGLNSSEAWPHIEDSCLHHFLVVQPLGTTHYNDSPHLYLLLPCTFPSISYSFKPLDPKAMSISHFYFFILIRLSFQQLPITLLSKAREGVKFSPRELHLTFSFSTIPIFFFLFLLSHIGLDQCWSDFDLPCGAIKIHMSFFLFFFF